MAKLILSKLKHKLTDEKVEYFLRINEQERINLNPLLGQKIAIKFHGDINCVACNRKIKKTFNNGYCFPCLQTLAECDLCIVKPELCHYDAGTCRDNEFATQHCNIDHSIYLSLTSSVKIGITRTHQERSRWIDQGASQAVRLITVARRKHAGIIEVRLAKKLPDKTDWRKMLRNQCDDNDLDALRSEAKKLMTSVIEELVIESEYGYLQALDPVDHPIVDIKYPVLEYPEKIKSHNLDKEPLVEGTLMGIKGQYLILDTGVLNMRKFAGYSAELLT